MVRNKSDGQSDPLAACVSMGILLQRAPHSPYRKYVLRFSAANPIAIT